jgi:DNA (cytosine-5)-methyltransferase 1
MLKIFDLFCGTGGFSIGFENGKGKKFETVLGIDVLPMSIETFKLNHPSALSLCEDIRKIRRADISRSLKIKRGEVDVIIGGPPCQGFSSIRPFRSSNDDDPRNSLFEEFASFVNYFRPKAFVLENVVGLATHKDGTTIEQMQECFTNIGYNCEWKILNAAHFGVPQKRERLIMIGLERGGKITFPKPKFFFDGPTIGHSRKDKMLTPKTHPSLFDGPEALVPALTVEDAIGDLPPIPAGGTATAYKNGTYNDFQKERRKNLSNLTMHDSTAHTPKMMEIIKHSGKNISFIPKHLIKSGFSSCYSRLTANEPSVTITVNFVHPASNRCIHPKQDRALTPREGARLQSFDDDFIFAGNRTQVVKQIGNAVPPLLGRTISETIGRSL